MKTFLTFIVGLVMLTLWWAWILMLLIGSLAHLDVVGASVSFVNSLPLGLGIVVVGVLPLGMLLVAAADADRHAPMPPNAKEPDPLRGPAPSGGYRPRHHSGR